MRDFISIRDFSRADLDYLLNLALEIKRGEVNLSSTLKGKSLASLFFEDSTRTRTSFEMAAHSLGMYHNGFAGPEGTSVKKGESLRDTVEMFRGYGFDILAMRHGLEGSARWAADSLDIPVLNGGDGSNQHPTQTLLDLLTIKENFGRLSGLTVALVGDLRYGRTVHSLLQGLGAFGSNKVLLTAPPQVAMPEWRVQE